MSSGVKKNYSACCNDLYQKELYQAVSEDVSGDYRTLLLELIGH